MTENQPNPFPNPSSDFDSSPSTAIERSMDHRVKPIPPDEDAWLRELEKNDPQAAHGQRLARMYGWKIRELIRYRHTGEMPLWMEVDPYELERNLAEQRRQKTNASETTSQPEMVDPHIEAYCKIDGLAPIFEWENLHQDWKRLAREKRIEESVIAEVTETLRQLVNQIVDSCIRYASILRSFSKNLAPTDRETAVERSNMDAARRRCHEALIDNANIIQRYVHKTLPERYDVQLPYRIFNPRALQNRSQVGTWAVLTDYFIQHRDLNLK